MYGLLLPVTTGAGKIQLALAKRMVVPVEYPFAIGRILFADFGDFVERQF